MIIYFVETERPEREYFRAELGDHDLQFVEDLGQVGSDAEIVSIFIYSRIDASFLEAHPRLRLIASRSGSTDHLDLDVCKEHGVAVAAVPTYSTSTVAEHTFALILALSRRLREAMSTPQQPGRFTYEGARGFDLAGKTLGVIGMGRIGQHVTKLSKAFEMDVISYDHVVMAPERAQRLGFTWVSLEEVLQRSHVLTLHARLTKETMHLINRETLALCRPGVLIINTARGRLIHTQALHEALESGQVGGAGLDVLEEERVMRETTSQIISAQIIEKLHADEPPSAESGAVEAQTERLKGLKEIVGSGELLKRMNVVFTPHVAFNSVEAVERLACGTVENIRAFVKGSPANPC